MAINRRQFCIGTATCIAGIAAGTDLVSGEQADDSCLLSACRLDDGRFALIVARLNGRIVRQIPLQGRGHDIALHQATGRAVAFARRPGTFAIAFSARDTSPPRLFTGRPDRHFYGHGVFSHHGRLLYATENDFDAARGMIGIYETQNYSRVGEFETHGIGPHDIAFLPDGRTLAVANGGIETHPESGRAKLNIDAIEPSLCFIDAQTGDLRSRHVLASHLSQLSIRHLAVHNNGTVWFGGQWEGGNDEMPSLLGRCGIDEPLRLDGSPESLGRKLNGYIASVAVSRDGHILAATATRAGRVIYIDTKRGVPIQTSSLPDVSGVVAFGLSGFVSTTGHGVLRNERPFVGEKVETHVPKIAFDNHVRLMGVA